MLRNLKTSKVKSGIIRLSLKCINSILRLRVTLTFNTNVDQRGTLLQLSATSNYSRPFRTLVIIITVDHPEYSSLESIIWYDSSYSINMNRGIFYTLRKHWKKSTFAALATGYGMYYMNNKHRCESINVLKIGTRV